MFGLKLPKQDVVYADMITHLWRDCLALRVGKRGEAHVNDDDNDDSNGTRAGPFCQGGRARGVSVRVSNSCLKGCGTAAAAADDMHIYVATFYFWNVAYVFMLQRSGAYANDTPRGGPVPACAR